MAYLHCHNKQCQWQQDDFWSSHYNPIQSLQDWEDMLLDHDLDVEFTDCRTFIEERGNLSKREVIAQELEKAALAVRNMKYKSDKEYRRKNPEGRCPQCGELLDID